MKTRLPLSLSLVLLSACGDSPMMPAELLTPPAPGEGIQLAMKSSLAAGQETERCQLFEVPSEGINIREARVRYNAGSHHVLLFSTPYRSMPATDREGVSIAAGAAHDCPLGPSSRWNVDALLAVAQDANAAPVIDLPADTAFQVEPGTILLIDTHYVNASSKPVDTEVRINLYSIPTSQAKQRAGIIFYYNPFIRVPAMGTASARMRCAINSDVTVFNLQSHMHRRGINFVANLVDAQGQKKEELYTNTDWEAVPMRSWDKTGRVFQRGDGFDYRCDYMNPEAQVVKQGARSTDEMCMLIGAYAPFDEKTSFCGAPFTDPLGLATWLGNGTKTCAETVGCLGNAMGDEATRYGCIVDSCEAVGPKLTALLQCQRRAPAGACKDKCGGSDPQGCSSCVQTACQSEIGTCLAATCQ